MCCMNNTPPTLPQLWEARSPYDQKTMREDPHLTLPLQIHHHPFAPFAPTHVNSRKITTRNSAVCPGGGGVGGVAQARVLPHPPLSQDNPLVMSVSLTVPAGEENLRPRASSQTNPPTDSPTRPHVLLPHCPMHTGKGVAVSHCITWFQTQHNVSDP